MGIISLGEGWLYNGSSGLWKILRDSGYQLFFITLDQRGGNRLKQQPEGVYMEEFPAPQWVSEGKKKKEQALFLRTPDGEQSHLGLCGLCRSKYLLYWSGSLGVYLKILSLVALRVRELYCGITWGFLWRSLSGAVPPLLPGPLNNDWSCPAPGHYA